MNFRYFASYDALTYIKHGHVLEINNELIGMARDREFSIEDGFRLSFYPQGFTRDELLTLFSPSNVKAILYTKKLDK